MKRDLSMISSHKGSITTSCKSPDNHKRVNKVVGGHAMAIRDLNRRKVEGKHAKLHDATITTKEFGQQDNNGQDSMQWHNREKDWYNAERRFIFSTPNSKMLRKWITLIEKDKKRTIAKTNSKINTRIGIK